MSWLRSNLVWRIDRLSSPISNNLARKIESAVEHSRPVARRVGRSSQSEGGSEPPSCSKRRRSVSLQAQRILQTAACRAVRPPDGQITELPVQPLPQKYSDFPKTQISFITFPVLSHRGAARDRYGRGTGCGGRVGAFDEQRRMRTAKSCGPDASTLASSWLKQVFADDGDKKARSPGRARHKP